jgi:midasin
MQLGSFAVDEGSLKSVLHNFNLQAPTARENAMGAVKLSQVLRVVILECRRLVRAIKHDIGG